MFQNPILLFIKKFYESTILALPTYINIRDSVEVEKMFLSKNCSDLEMMVRMAKLCIDVWRGECLDGRELDMWHSEKKEEIHWNLIHFKYFQ